MSNYTKGEWIIESKIGREDARGYWVRDKNGKYLAMVCIRDDEAEEFPNARLIAAAPDLLEAAKAVVARWETPLWKEAPATAIFIASLRAAVAKATGQ